MKKNKNLIILLLVAIIGIVGVTIAYFSSRATFENVFETQDYGTTYTEKFISPDNWLPGDETEKTLEVRNSGNVDEAVRVKVEESWVSKRGTKLPLTQGNNVAADIHWINGDDWTKVTVDGEDYYYYYYNYKLAPNETTSKLLDKVTFNSAITSSATCSDTVVNGVTTRTCNSDGTGYDGATYTLILTVETIQYNKYKEAWGTGNVITLLDEKPEPVPTGVEYLMENATNPNIITSYNDVNADKGKMFVFNHTVNNETVTEARYIGDEPKNYVYFNCDNDYDMDTCEVWRIIGIFDIDDGDGNTKSRIKIVSGSVLENRAFNSDSNNDWTVAPLNTYLNTEYYNGIAANGLTTSAREKIGVAKYYLGAVSTVSVKDEVEKIYIDERGNTLCGACNNDNEKMTWIGNVGLMYPSDMYMVYYGVDNNCYSNPYQCQSDSSPAGMPTKGWIYNSNILTGGNNPTYTWLLSSNAGFPGIVLYGDPTGALYGYGSRNNYGVRPVVYLSADVKITDGDGSEDDPYVLTD